MKYILIYHFFKYKWERDLHELDNLNYQSKDVLCLG